MKKIFLSLLLLVGPLAAQESPATIDGIVITSDSDLKPESEEKIQMTGLHLPGPASDMHARLASFIGKSLCSENLLEIKLAILSFFSDHDHPFIAVEIPEQKIENGCVQFVVIEPTIDQVCYTGNKWFSSKSIAKATSVASGSALDEQLLQNNLSWMNSNPFIHTDLILSPGTDPKSTNVEVVTKDKFPLRVYAGVDDTGSKATNQDRFFTGFNTSLGLNTLLTYQFMSSFDFPEFLSHYANLTFFLPWKHQFVVYGGLANIHPDISGFSSKGTNAQASLRYDFPINALLYKPGQNHLRFGYDYKRVGNSLFFLGDVPTSPVPISNQTAAISQFYLGYHFENVRSNPQFTLHAETFFSPFLMVPNQTQADYNDLRLGANPRYLYARAAFGSIYTLPKNFSVSFLLRAQGATTALLPSEQFGLGGYDTVRGYDERVFLADDAVCANLEFRAPSIALFPKTCNELIFLAFADFGWGHNVKTSFAEGTATQLYSVGPGVRYNIGSYLTSRLDYGFRLHTTPFEPSGFGRFHFSVIIGY